MLISIYLLIGLLLVFFFEKFVYKSRVGGHFDIVEALIVLELWPYLIILYLGTLVISLIRGYRNLK